MFWFLSILIAVALLAGWAAWREKRYGGSTRSNAVDWGSKYTLHGPAEFPWGSNGRRSGGKKEDRD